MSAHEQVITAVEKMRKAHPGAKFVVSGHSLGGALSVVSALKLIEIYGSEIEIREIHTFGQPRVGNEAFAHYTIKQLPTFYRVVHYRDVISHMPELVFGYKHTPTEVFFSEMMSEYEICDQTGEDPKCSNKFTALDILDHEYYFHHFFAKKC